IEYGIIGRWDGARLEQVLVNLLSNALKYAIGAPVRVGLRRVGEWVELIVQDEGPGIPKEHQARIFRRFERAVSSKKVSGMGLGLFICRGILEAHEGTIELE